MENRRIIDGLLGAALGAFLAFFIEIRVFNLILKSTSGAPCYPFGLGALMGAVLGGVIGYVYGRRVPLG